MKQELVSCMDKEEQNAVDILQKFGITKNVAKVSIFFLFNERATSPEIEKSMNMRQPEVSLGMKSLVKEKLISPIKKPTSTKGRPKIIYTRNCTCEKINQCLLQKAKDKIEDLRKQQHNLHLLMAKLS